MRTVKGRIPLAGVYHFNIVVPDDMTDKEVFAKLAKDFNSSSRNTKLLPTMMTGTIVNFPLTFATVDETIK